RPQYGRDLAAARPSIAHNLDGYPTGTQFIGRCLPPTRPTDDIEKIHRPSFVAHMRALRGARVRPAGRRFGLLSPDNRADADRRALEVHDRARLLPARFGDGSDAAQSPGV